MPYVLGMTTIRDTMVTDKTGGILQPDGLDLRFEWSTRGKDAGYLYMKQPDGAGAGKHYQAWCIETYPTVEDIPDDLRTLDWWVNTYQRIAVEKNGE